MTQTPHEEHHCRDFDETLKTRHVSFKTLRSPSGGQHPQTLTVYTLGHTLTRNASDQPISFCPYCGETLLHPWMQQLTREKTSN